MTFCFKPNKRQLTAAEVGRLRKECELSVAEIQRRAAADLALFDIPVFAGEWPASKPRVVALLAAIEAGALPMRVLLVQQTSTVASEEELTVAEAREWLQRFRAIALEQDMHQQLELGHIASPGEYVAPPEDGA